MYQAIEDIANGVTNARQVAHDALSKADGTPKRIPLDLFLTNDEFIELSKVCSADTKFQNGIRELINIILKGWPNA